MGVIGTCMHCSHGIRNGDTAWTLNVHHEKAEEGPRPDGSHGVCVEVIEAWTVLYICEDCMKKHATEWMHTRACGSKPSCNDPQIRDTTDEKL